MIELSLLLCCGLTAGILTGMIGIGGGLVIVPGLLIILKPVVGADVLMKVCVATSLATIPFTAAWAAYHHHRRGNLELSKARDIGFGVAVGALLGGLCSPLFSESALKFGFAVFASYIGLKMYRGRALVSTLTASRLMDGSAGAAVGALSGLIGIGGTMMVPYLLASGLPFLRAAAVSSAVGVVVATFASIGFAISAHTHHTDIAGAFGYVHKHAFFAVTSASMLGGYVGVRCAHRISAPSLKRCFAVVLLISAAKVIVESIF